MTCGAVRVPMRRMCRVFPVLERCVGASINGQSASPGQRQTGDGSRSAGVVRCGRLEEWSGRNFTNSRRGCWACRLGCAGQGITVWQLWQMTQADFVLEHSRRGRSSGGAAAVDWLTERKSAVSNLVASRRVDVRRDCAHLTQFRRWSKEHFRH